MSCCCPIVATDPYGDVVIVDRGSRGMLSQYIEISDNGNAKRGLRPYLQSLFFDAAEFSVDANGFSIPKAMQFEAAFVDVQHAPPQFTLQYGPQSLPAVEPKWWLARLPSLEYSVSPGSGSNPAYKRVMMRRLTSFASFTPSANSRGMPVPRSTNTGNRYCDLWVFTAAEQADFRASLAVQLVWVECTCDAG